MAFMDIEIASSSSATHGRKYQVFLSFRGTDTRTTFTSHLYNALNQKGIVTFRDDKELEQGTVISPELLKAIEESKFAVVILSKDYALSSWCLTELAKIIECKKKTGLIVVPIFYHVDPSDVRYQKKTFDEAFTKHKKRTKDNILDTWRAALAEVANLSGIHLQDQDESEVIKKIVGEICGKLASTCPIVDKDLVGIIPLKEELVNLLGMGLNDVRFIGIWGMGGIGKTTLAEVVYERFRYNFDGSSFLARVREKSGEHGGLVSLQKQLLSDVLFQRSTDFPIDQWRRLSMIIQERLSHKRVLVILDDLDHLDQLEALASDQSWFGQGSRIIITTRDQGLLIKAQKYELKVLNNDESLKLFSRNAFEKDHPLEGYEELSKRFIYYAHGLPLTLKVLGRSFLHQSDPNLWESSLCKFKENLSRDIMDVLQISFEGLEEREKNIFLDIACFFRGKCERSVTNTLQILYDRPEIDIDVLIKKSLITISYGVFQMHDLIQELGKKIVRGESPEEAGGRSRLWRTEDVLHVLKDNTGTKLVKGIFLNSPLEKEMHLNAEAFSKMKNLRLLKINNVNLPEGLNYLSSELRFIHWDGYPLASTPTSFEPEELVELHMRCSLIKQLWMGIKHLNELNLIDLSDSQNLIETPDLTGVPNLKELILRGCTRLYKIHASLGNLKRLIRLDLNGCKCLEILPLKINLESVEVLDLSGCSRLKKLPEIVGNMPRLSKLSLRGCNVLSPTRWNKLLSFFLMQRRSPDPMGMLVRILQGLTQLDLGYCNIQAIPDVLGCFSSLKILNLKGNKIVCLPKSIIRLSHLEELELSGCMDLRLIPELPLNVSRVYAYGCTLLETSSSSEFVGSSLRFLNCMKLVDCDILSAIARGHYQFQEDIFNGVIIPGSEIPIWFSHRSVGSSVNLPVPSDFLCNESMGLVVCAVFVLREHHPFDQLPRVFMNNTHMIKCYLNRSSEIHSTGFSEEFGKIESDHLWLKYHRPQVLTQVCREAFSRSDANGFIQINFQTEGLGLEVTKCGAHLAYNGWCVITPNEDDSAKDTKIQQSHDDYVGDELAGFSGEAGTSKSNDVDVTHPKRILFPTLIERLVLCFLNWIGNSFTQGQGDLDCEEEEGQGDSDCEEEEDSDCEEEEGMLGMSWLDLVEMQVPLNLMT